MSLLLHFWAFSGLVGGNEEHPSSLSQFLLLRFLINRNLNKFDKKMKLTYKRRSMYITIICSLVAIFLTAIIPFNAKAVAFPSIMDVDNAVKQKRKREILKKTGEQVQEEVNERKNQKEEEHLSLKEAQKVEIAELKIQSNDNQNSDAVDSKANNKLSKKQTLAVKSESVLESELEQYKSLKELSKSEDWTDVQFLEDLILENSYYCQIGLFTPKELNLAEYSLFCRFRQWRKNENGATESRVFHDGKSRK